MDGQKKDCVCDDQKKGKMIIELLGFVAPRGKRTDLSQTLFSSLGPTRVTPGCLGCRLFHDADANTHYLESRWASEADVIRHIRSDAYKRLLLLMELGADAPSIEFFTVSEVRGLDFIKSARQCQVVSNLP
jgi:quinol monooxygenase YgiN